MSEIWERGEHPAQAEVHEPIEDVENPFEDVPAPSRFDLENLRSILTGELGDWFDADLFRLIRHADLSNRERLRMVYPLHVRAYESYLKGES
jgi:hypothetical protein